MNNLVFPSKLMNTYNQALNYYNQKAYSMVVKSLKEDIKEIKKTPSLAHITKKAYEILIESFYRLNQFEKVIIYANDILQTEYESDLVNYYVILAYIGLSDFNGINMYLKQSTVISQILPSLLDGDYTYYSAISLNYDNMLEMVMANFSCELIREIYAPFSKLVCDSKYLLTRFFDLINLLNEYGYPSEVILKITDDISNIFSFDM